MNMGAAGREVDKFLQKEFREIQVPVLSCTGRLRVFFAELKRRHIYRVAAAYAVVAWLLLQLFNNLTPVMKLLDWARTLVLVLLIGGLPIAMFFAWMLELKTQDESAKTGLADWVLVGVLLVVIALVSYQQFAMLRTAVTTLAPMGVDAARTAAAKPLGLLSRYCLSPTCRATPHRNSSPTA